MSWVQQGDEMQNAWGVSHLNVQHRIRSSQLGLPVFDRTAKETVTGQRSCMPEIHLCGDEFYPLGLDGNFTLKVGQKHCTAFPEGVASFFLFFVFSFPISPFPTGFGKKLISHHGANRIVARTANVKELSQKDTLEKLKTFLACLKLVVQELCRKQSTQDFSIICSF